MVVSVGGTGAASQSRPTSPKARIRLALGEQKTKGKKEY
jgi:hypothetical protein